MNTRAPVLRAPLPTDVRFGPSAPAVRLRSDCGLDLAPDAGRWFDEPDEHDLVAIEGLTEPVLDVGCGPGRIVAHLARRGTTALGVDVSAAALAHARSLGAPVLLRSVFDPLPGTGRWGAALLLDGNIGIGGDPTALLRRLHDLLRPGGIALVEVGAPGTGTRRLQARFSVDGHDSEWFPWAIVGAEAIEAIGDDAGLTCAGVRYSGPRWFATLRKP